MKRGYLDFKMLAYYSPRIFYSTTLNSEKNRDISGNPETVYWKPEIKIGPEGETVITFSMKERVPLNVTIEGISLNGIPGFLNKQIRF